MRTVHLEGNGFRVSEDPNKVISDFLGYALSLHVISKRPAAEEFAERFSPGGQGMSIPDVFVAYRAESPDDLPFDLSEESRQELLRKEVWVLLRDERGRGPDSAMVDGPELRHLLQEALSQRSANPAQG